MSGPIRYLAVEDLVKVGSACMEMLIRDPGALASAAARPQMSVFGEDAYPDLPSKASALLHSITRNHPLVDGNKRLGWAGTLVFLRVNGYTVDIGEDAAVELVLRVAAGEVDTEELTKTFRLIMRPIP